MLWLGDYSITQMIGLAIQSMLIQNILLFYFLGMCSYLACSTNVATANGLGAAVTVVITLSGMLNWCIHTFITAPKALTWLNSTGIDFSKIDLSFLEFLIFIAVIAGLVQILEIIIDQFFPQLYRALGMYLPLITVNCAILGASLFSIVREYPFVPNTVYVFFSGLGWWLAIVLIASIREKLEYSHMPKGLKGMGITFITTGLLALSFMGFTGINLDKKPMSVALPKNVKNANN